MSLTKTYDSFGTANFEEANKWNNNLLINNIRFKLTAGGKKRTYWKFRIFGYTDEEYEDILNNVVDYYLD